MKKKLIVLLFLLLLGPAWAAPIVDGGFESGAFGFGWTDLDGNATFGSTPHTGVQAVGFPDLFAGGSVFTGSIQQDLTTVAGQFYTLTFFLDNTSGTDNNELSVFFDGSPLMSGPLLLAAGYTQFTFSGLQASSPTTSLFFALGSGDGEVLLDDVDVQLEGAPEISANLAGLPCALVLGLLLVVQSGRRPRAAKEGLALGLLLSLAGCGNSGESLQSFSGDSPRESGSAPAAVSLAPAILAKTQTLSIPLRKGWNTVAFQTRNLTSVSISGPAISGFAFQRNGAKVTGRASDLNQSFLQSQGIGPRALQIFAPSSGSSLDYSGDNNGRLTVPLEQGLNLVSFPADSPVSVSSLSWPGGSPPSSLTELNQDGTGTLVNPSAPGATLQPGKAYWMTSPVSRGAISQANGRIFLGQNLGQGTVSSYSRTASGNAPTPVTSLTGASTQMGGNGNAVVVDRSRNLLYATIYSSKKICVFSSADTTSGDVAPIRTITNSTNVPNILDGLALDAGRDRLYVGNQSSLLIYNNASTLNGAVAPSARIDGFSSLMGITLDPTNDRLFASNLAGTSIFVFDHASNLAGTLTLASTASRTATSVPAAGGLFIDPASQRLYVAQTGSTNKVNVYADAGSLGGSVTPSAVLTGTGANFGSVCYLAVDTVHDELFVRGASTLYAFSSPSQWSGAVTAPPDRSISGLTSLFGVWVVPDLD